MFGTVVIWFLPGGEIYALYTLIAVPGVAVGYGLWQHLTFPAE